jgi:hypothetical protein
MKSKLATYFLPILFLGGMAGVLIHIYDYYLPSFMAGVGLAWPIATIISIVLIIKKRIRHTSLKGTILNIALVVITMIFVPFGITPPEGKFIFNPDIDTLYSSGYSDRQFKKVSIGMNEEEVMELLGEPFHKNTVDWAADFNVIWLYSGDGASSHDFAWKRKQIHFKDGIVVERHTGWSYD